MIRYIFREINISTTVKKDSIDKVNVLVKIIVTTFIIILSIVSNKLSSQLILLLYPLLMSLLSRDKSLYIHSIKAPLIPAVLVTAITLLFSKLTVADIINALTLGIRILVIAATISVFIASTSPFDLAYFLEKLHVPKWIALSIIMIWNIIPRSMKIADEAYTVSHLKKEPLWRSLISTIAVTLAKSHSQVEALYLAMTAEIKNVSFRPLTTTTSIINTITFILASIMIGISSFIIYTITAI